jgi:proteasome lid subunit RPN8/RPN11
MTTEALYHCAAEALHVAEQHVLSDVSREVGGVLVGTINDGRASVVAAVPAQRAVGAAGHVTFTHEVWEEVLPIVDRDYPDGRIVGWYHSHPGFGLFLSEYDQFIQENFFPEPPMLALVIDPLAGEGGWFLRRDGKIDLVDRFDSTKAERPAAAAAAASEVQAKRRTRALGTAGLLVLAFVAGYLFRGSEGSGGGNVAALRAARDELTTARADKARLEAALRATESPAPAPDGPDVAAAPSSGEPQTGSEHIVQRGDTLWSIAEQRLGSGYAWPRIAKANPGLVPDLIVTGRRLVIPPSN